MSTVRTVILDCDDNDQANGVVAKASGVVAKVKTRWQQLVHAQARAAGWYACLALLPVIGVLFFFGVLDLGAVLVALACWIALGWLLAKMVTSVAYKVATAGGQVRVLAACIVVSTLVWALYNHGTVWFGLMTALMSMFVIDYTIRSIASEEYHREVREETTVTEEVVQQP